MAICAEWIDYMNAWRVYDNKRPEWTLMYGDSTEEIVRSVRRYYDDDVMFNFESKRRNG